MKTKLKAADIPVGEWFFVLRTHKWFKKIGENETYVEGTQIGSLSTHNIPKDEEVELKTKK